MRCLFKWCQGVGRALPQRGGGGGVKPARAHSATSAPARHLTPNPPSSLSTLESHTSCLRGRHLSQETLLQKGRCLRTYPGSNRKGPNPSHTSARLRPHHLPTQHTHTHTQRGSLRQRRDNAVTTQRQRCDNADTRESPRSQISCDVFHLFVNGSLEPHSVRTTAGLSRNQRADGRPEEP